MEEIFCTQLQIDLVDSIRNSLDNHIYSNAVFLAERLLAENDCEESRGILAECYMAEMKAYKAYHILKGCKSEQNRYKFAIVCLKLNRPKELQEAEKVLLSPAKNSNSKIGFNTVSKYDNVPNGAFGFYILGIISEKLHRISEAKELYKKALEINPSLWTAYEKLLKLGEFINPDEIFQESRFKLPTKASFPPSSSNQLNQARKLPSDMGIEEPAPKSNAFEIEQEASIKPAPLKSSSLSTNDDSNTLRFPDPINVNRFGSLKPTPEFQEPMNQSGSAVGNSPSFRSAQKNLPQGSYNGLMNLLQALGEPYMNLIGYNSEQSIEGFQKLSENHYATGWVLCNIGRAYSESAKYSDAEKYFEHAYQVEPYKLEGLEYYSTCLWHLKKQVDLCKLAHSSLEKSMFAPEPWIVLGNCFSLQKEHENALKFFNRAIQLNSSLPYAHTLSGHEYVYNEDFQRARKCFENALNIDIRHYNAWWGLGYINYKQEKYERAIDSFLKALSINPKNPVLYSYLGMTCVAQDNLLDALKYFQQSELLDEKNVMNRFQKANVLFKLERHNEALAELDILRSSMPREAPIPQLIGKIYKHLGMIDKAHHFFTLALDLENKDTQKIKAMIDALHETNEFNDDHDV